MLIDTHCHIHEREYSLDTNEVLLRARENGVKKMICVGTNEQSSREALEFASAHEGIYAAVGVHPHDTKDGWNEIEKLVRQMRQWVTPSGAAPAESSRFSMSEEGADSVAGPASATSETKLIAIGEIGLDYFYNHSPRDIQIKALESQMQTALNANLPIIFHVRGAFDDFWPIFDNFSGIRGELHSFTDIQLNLEEGLKRGLFVGVNGISTFTKDKAQQQLFASIPLKNLLLETDSPFLTPIPNRGKVNEPAFVRDVASHHAAIRGITIDEIATVTSTNATALFAL